MKRPAKTNLNAKVAWLSRPEAYDPRPDRVEPAETHMSWVFLTDREVWKLKKPVRYLPLDFSTLEARARHCAEEVRLNRRLAPEVYLGVHRLTRRPAGGFAIDGDGPVVDWLVRMRRLPASRMLDQVIVRGELQPGTIDALADVLAGFYRDCSPADISPRAFLARFARRQGHSRKIIGQFEAQLDGSVALAVVEAVDQVLACEGALLKARARAGGVVEGHGDLRAEHVCLIDPPCVIDCLEFDRELRLMDPFEEIAFLGLDCARLGAAWVGPRLVAGLAEALDTHPPQRLIDFYTAYHACIRARLALAHLLDKTPRTPEKWPGVALAYFEAAQPAAERLRAPSDR